MDIKYLKGQILDAENKLGQDKIKLRQAQQQVFQLTQDIRMQEQSIEWDLQRMQKLMNEQNN